MIGWLRSLFRPRDRRPRVSSAWIHEHAVDACKDGWEGPRWRLRSEGEPLRRNGNRVVSIRSRRQP